MWMDSRHNTTRASKVIQRWDIPRKEKGFFTVYAMNLVLESDGFDCLASQPKEDVAAFIKILRRLGAEKTSAFVRSTLATLSRKTPLEENKCTSKYYRLFAKDEVWLKLLEYVGQRIFAAYCLKAQAINDAGKSVFDSKQWRGKLPRV
jgi:hypothetical protein